MQNPSRRAFLGGKAPELAPWDQFLLELKRKTQGSVQVVDVNAKQALCTVKLSTDIHHARQLCQTFGVKLYVGIPPESEADYLEPSLGLDVSALNQLEPVNDTGTQWFMQAGVTVAQLREVGFVIPEAVPGSCWVAQWLGNGKYQRYSLAQIAHSGLVHASLVMADGSVASLGLFGVKNTKPLNTPTLRSVVPQLFQLANTPLAHELLQQPIWPAKYRLDIFSAHNPSLNLAHLLLGADQDLGVLDWVVMDRSRWQAAPLLQSVPALEPKLQVNAQELDAAAKALFDPELLFAYALA